MTYEEAIELAKDALCRNQDPTLGPNPYIHIQSVADALVHAYNCGRGSVTVQPCDCAAVVALRQEADALKAELESERSHSNLLESLAETDSNFETQADLDAALGRLVRQMPSEWTLERSDETWFVRDSQEVGLEICTTPEAALLAAGVVATEAGER